MQQRYFQTTASYSAMKGGSKKTRKRDLRKTPVEKNTREVLCQNTEQGNALPDCAMVQQLPASSLLCTPKRSRRMQKAREVKLNNTPVESSSPDIFSNIAETLTGADQVELEYTESITQSKPSDSDPSCTKSVSPGRHERTLASRPKKRQRKNKKQACRKNNSLSDKPSQGNQKKQTGIPRTEPVKCRRQKFEEKTDEEDSPLSSSLSIELSHQEEQLPYFSFDEDEELDEEDEDLPSVLQNDRKPTPIRKGMFVWYKLRKFPFWPSLVKSVNHRQKKASILFIDNPMIYTRKGFVVALKALKPFDCEEANDLVSKAKENYQDIILWSLELISDYRIRIACDSFSGSFIEYCAHDMSHPVMKTFPQGVSVSPTVTSNEETEMLSHDGEDNVGEQQDTIRNQKRLLPDRSYAAHNRANEKLVNFIVKQRMVEKRLLAVIHGQQESSWFQHFKTARGRRVVNTYLEDEQQLDEVYWYLNELYTKTVATSSGLRKLKFIDLVSFILDVLLPEAIISAIAGVDNISLQKAEEKFRRGRSISSRESQEFDVMIERYRLSKLLPPPGIPDP